jgi:hypothetical protein
MVRVLTVALGMPALRRLGVEQRALDAMEVEKQRQHQPDRPAADDRDLGGRVSHQLPAHAIPLADAGASPALAMGVSRILLVA